MSEADLAYVNMDVKPEVHAFFDPDSNTISYVVRDPASDHCAIVDSVMDLDYAAGRVHFEHADEIIEFTKSRNWILDWQIETHVHADHLSAAPYIQEKLGGKIGIGEKVKEVQEIFGKVFNEGTDFQRDGSQFDALFADGDRYQIGTMTAVALYTPGHTPACMTHIIGDAAFVGDTLFMPDAGTARADFPGGNARELFHSTRRILALPDAMRLFLCHDYGPNDREIIWETTVGGERRHNIHVGDGIKEDDFVKMREARDATLDMPRLIMPSIQVNMRAGHLPKAENNGTIYLKVPVTDMRSGQ